MRGGESRKAAKETVAGNGTRKNRFHWLALDTGPDGKSTRRTIMTEQEIAQALADFEAHQKRKQEVAERAKR